MFDVQNKRAYYFDSLGDSWKGHFGDFQMVGDSGSRLCSLLTIVFRQLAAKMLGIVFTAAEVNDSAENWSIEKKKVR